VIVGGTRAIGLEMVKHYAAQGREVILTGQYQENVDNAVAEVGGSGGSVRGIAFDLARPHKIKDFLADIGPVSRLALVAIDRDQNTVADYDMAAAVRLATIKLVAYTEVVHTLRPRMHDDSAIVIFGGRAKDRPYPGSTTVSTVNGGVVGMVNSMVTELKPIRVNGLHPGIIGDSPYWAAKPEAVEATRARTPTGRLASMADIVGAVDFLLTNRGVNGVQLDVDNGWLLI
jgi:NAD(P)-dependent dehydrogenase (short-subunit alcohol dehydrogenase family)